jgi:hypothetical protein
MPAPCRQRVGAPVTVTRLYVAHIGMTRAPRPQIIPQSLVCACLRTLIYYRKSFCVCVCVCVCVSLARTGNHGLHVAAGAAIPSPLDSLALSAPGSSWQKADGAASTPRSQALTRRGARLLDCKTAATAPGESRLAESHSPSRSTNGGRCGPRNAADPPWRCLTAKTTARTPPIPDTHPPRGNARCFPRASKGEQTFTSLKRGDIQNSVSRLYHTDSAPLQGCVKTVFALAGCAR